MPESDLLSIAEAAEVCGLSVDSLRRYTREGRLECLRTPGGHRRFRRSDVENLLRPSETSDVAAPEPIPSGSGATSPEVDQ